MLPVLLPKLSAQARKLKLWLKPIKLNKSETFERKFEGFFLLHTANRVVLTCKKCLKWVDKKLPESFQFKCYMMNIKF